MVSAEYIEYLKSPTWQRLRSERLKIDGYKCQKCGRPFDLDVHHLRYPKVLGTENPYTDLITLCRNCHDEIEGQKTAYREQQNEQVRKILEQAERQRLKREEEYHHFFTMLRETIREKEHHDLSNVGTGKLDLCNIDVIREEFGPALSDYEDRFGYISRIQGYFRNKRYKIILSMMEKGFTQKEVIDKTGFSYNMVRKVFAKPLNAKKIIEKEITYNEQAC